MVEKRLEAQHKGKWRNSKPVLVGRIMVYVWPILARPLCQLSDDKTYALPPGRP